MSEKNTVLQHFKDLSKIPRGSGNTAAVSAYIKSLAEEKGLSVKQDELGNLLIQVDATANTDLKPVILQGHMDMVCEKTPESEHDFLKDPILPLISEDGWIYAEGTTLGADNGIAIAYMLALLDEKNLKHPPLFFLITVDEETNMGGAAKLDPSWLEKSDYLINIDSEEEGYFTCGSAGGVSIKAYYHLERTDKEGERIDLTLTGLKGGHSGMEIDRFGANANVLLARILLDLHDHSDAFSVDLINMDGGKFDNVIPKEAKAQLLVTGDSRAFFDALDASFALYKDAYAGTDPEMDIKADSLGVERASVLTQESQNNLLFAVSHMPNGVFHMEDGLVLRSSNLGGLHTSGNQAVLNFGLRGNSPAHIELAQNHLCQYIEYTGAIYEAGSPYPAWPAKRDSKLLSLVKQLYENSYGREPIIWQIHAGLECSYFAQDAPHLDIVSFGPDLEHVHTPDERTNLQSVNSVYDFLKSLLESMPNTLGNDDKEKDSEEEDDDVLEIIRSDGTPVSMQEILKTSVKNCDIKTDCSDCEADCEIKKS